MKIAVMGTGGVGGLFGTRLAQTGCDVTFIARGHHLEAIRKHGLRVLSEHLGDALIAKAKATSDPTEVGVVDHILFTVKLWDTESAARLIKPMVGENTAVISLQNGVARDEVLRREVGEKHVVGGISYVAATIEEPGVIIQRGNAQKLVIGEYGAEPSSPRVQKLKEACEKAGIEVTIPDDIEKALWNKFVALVGMSTLTAATRLSVGPVRENPETRALLVRTMKEVYEVGLKKGVNLESSIVDTQMQYMDSLAPDVTASMEHDLRHGNRLELPWLAGAVVDMGKELGVETPVCSILSAILSPYLMGDR